MLEKWQHCLRNIDGVRRHFLLCHYTFPTSECVLHCSAAAFSFSEIFIMHQGLNDPTNFDEVRLNREEMKAISKIMMAS